MTKSMEDTKKLDDELADFTDRILGGEITEPNSPAGDEKLLHLEQTVLHLNQSFPHRTLDERTIKRMQADMNNRRRKISPQDRPVFWWSQQTRQRFGLAFAAVILAIAGFLIIPSFSSGKGISASAGLHPLSVGLLVLLVGVLLLVVWLAKSRK